MPEVCGDVEECIEKTEREMRTVRSIIKGMWEGGRVIRLSNVDGRKDGHMRENAHGQLARAMSAEILTYLASVGSSGEGN